MSQDLLRHTVATLAYRAGKALRGAPPEFAEYRADSTGRTPVQILAHMGDLFDWALSIANGQQTWHNSAPLAVGPGGARVSSPRSRRSTRGWPPSEPLAASGREAVPGPDCRRPHSRRPDRHAAAHGRMRHARRELFRRGYRGGPRGNGAGRAETSVLTLVYCLFSCLNFSPSFCLCSRYWRRSRCGTN